MIRNQVILAILLQTLVYYSSVKASPLNRIIDGSIAHENQFPWHVSLHIERSNSDHLRYCGGSLISKEFVLTSATCLSDARHIRVDMGSTIFLKPRISRISTQFISHSQFNANTNANNIGIIRLSEPIGEYENTLRAILIPNSSHANKLYAQEPALVSGYGVTTIGDNHLSNNLMFARQTTMTNDECQLSLDPAFVHADSICARPDTTQTAYHGDMGGPLVIQYENITWIQIGIVSTINPSDPQGPVLFTRLTSHIDWIEFMTGVSNDF